MWYRVNCVQLYALKEDPAPINYVKLINFCDKNLCQSRDQRTERILHSHKYCTFQSDSDGRSRIDKILNTATGAGLDVFDTGRQNFDNSTRTLLLRFCSSIDQAKSLGLRGVNCRPDGWLYYIMQLRTKVETLGMRLSCFVQQARADVIAINTYQANFKIMKTNVVSISNKKMRGIH